MSDQTLNVSQEWVIPNDRMKLLNSLSRADQDAYDEAAIIGILPHREDFTKAEPDLV